MANLWVEIDLFIAPDGSFKHVNPDITHWKTLVEPQMSSEEVQGLNESITVSRWKNKMYYRYRLKAPCGADFKKSIRDWSSGTWDNFVQEVIHQIEAAGDAPWRKT